MMTTCLRCDREIEPEDEPMCDGCWGVHEDDHLLTDAEKRQLWAAGDLVYCADGELRDAPPEVTTLVEKDGVWTAPQDGSET
jgi:hypothetical protein